MLVVRNNLPRCSSLKKKADIDQLFDSGKKISGDCFLLFWDYSDSFQQAVLVSRSHGNAVVRNRIKRVYREAIRQNAGSLKKPIKAAFLPGKTKDHKTLEQINAEVRRIFDRINQQSENS